MAESEGVIMLAVVKYQYGQYSGEINVPCDENDCNEDIINKAKRIVRKNSSLSMVYESYKIISRWRA